MLESLRLIVNTTVTGMIIMVIIIMILMIMIHIILIVNVSATGMIHGTKEEGTGEEGRRGDTLVTTLQGA